MSRSSVHLAILLTALSALACLLPSGYAAAATFVVDSASDQAPAGDSNPGDGICEDERAGTRCTLRAAIQEANARPGLDTINFSIASTIFVQDTALTAISDALILDGRSAPGYVNSGNLASSPPRVTIDGTLLSGTPWGLTVRSADAALSDIHALSVVGFAGGGVRAMTNAHGLWMQGCYIGIRPGGIAAGNGTGVSLVTNNNLIGRVGLPGFGTGIGNVISANSGIGVLALGSGTLLRGNFIGVGITGAGDFGNGDDGVQMLGSDNWIGDGAVGGGNLITHNGGDGIRLLGDDNRILGNDIGGFGLSTFGNAGHGIAVFGDDNIIGDDTTQGRNLVRGNVLANVQLGSDASHSNRTVVMNNQVRSGGQHGVVVQAGMRNRIVGNEIGDNDGDGIRVVAATTTGIADNRVGFVTGGTGTVFASPNTGIGIHAAGNATYIGFDVVGDTLVAGGNTVGFSGGDGIVLAGNASRASLNHVGVTASGDDIGNAGMGIRLLGGTGTANLLVTGNVVGNNGESGIAVHAEDARLCTNRIGTTAAGADIGNAQDGIWLSGDNNTVGDGASCAGNTVGFNALFGIRVTSAGNLVNGNWIGVASNGADIGNGASGILLVGAGTTGNHISANGLGYNENDGVQAGTSGNDNAIELNAFIANGGEPIDLGPGGPTPNDPQDVDTGPNRLQNHPEIEFATIAADLLQVTWRVDSAALNSSYPLAVDFYLDRGDGAVDFIGRFSYPTPFAIANGNLTLPPGATGGQLYAMATDNQGNSSELSAPRGVGLPDALFSDGFE